MFKEYSLDRHLSRMMAVRQRVEADFAGFRVRDEKEIRLFSSLIKLVESGKHTWTMMYKPGQIRFPLGNLSMKNAIYVLETSEEKAAVRIGYITIEQLAIGLVSEWPERHPAIAGAGWKSKERMVQSLSEVYQPVYGKKLEESDILVAYRIGSFERERNARPARQRQRA